LIAFSDGKPVSIFPENALTSRHGNLIRAGFGAQAVPSWLNLAASIEPNQIDDVVVMHYCSSL
jgi:hypothetical protein